MSFQRIIIPRQKPPLEGSKEKQDAQEEGSFHAIKHSFDELMQANRHKTDMMAENVTRWTIIVLWVVASITGVVIGGYLLWMMFVFTSYITGDIERLSSFLLAVWNVISSGAVIAAISLFLYLIKRGDNNKPD